jgi:hypothetical protein
MDEMTATEQRQMEHAEPPMTNVSLQRPAFRAGYRAALAVSREREQQLEEALTELVSQHEVGYILPPPGALGQGDVRSEAWNLARAALARETEEKADG